MEFRNRWGAEQGKKNFRWMKKWRGIFEASFEPLFVA